MRTVDEVMTRDPVVIAPEETLAHAKECMREAGVRHLPVLEGHEVVGILSEREVDLIAAIAEPAPDEISVRRAMLTNVLVVAPGDALAAVASQMAAAKCGSAVVIDEPDVVGIFTTVDALAALAERETAA